MVFLLCVIRKKWRDKTLNVTTRKKKSYVTSKVWYREFSRISNIGIAIIEKWIAFRDRDTLNSNPDIIRKLSSKSEEKRIPSLYVMSSEFSTVSTEFSTVQPS